MSALGWSQKQTSTTSFGGQTITRSERVFVVVLLATLVVAITAFGSDRNDLALMFSALLSGEFAVGLCFRDIRAGLVRQPATLVIPGLLFILCLAAVAWATTPFSPNGAHPVWAYVGKSAITVDQSALLIGLLKLAGLAFTFLFGFAIGGRDDRARFFFRCFVAAISIYGIWALVSRGAPDMFLSFSKGFQGNRLSASFQSSNTAGALFGMAFIYAIALCFEKARSINDLRKSPLYELALYLIAIFLVGTCLVLTLSRGAVGATIIAACCFLVWEAFARSWRATGRNALVNTIVAAGGFAVLCWSASSLFDRYMGSNQDSVMSRQTILVVHWQAFLDAPWFGYGIGTFSEINKLIETAVTFPSLWQIRAAHNVYLQWLEGTGVIGSLPMFACLGWILYAMAYGATKRRRMTTWLRAGFAASLVLLIQGWADFSLEVPAVAMTWAALLGCGYAVSRGRREQSSETPASALTVLPLSLGIASVALALTCLLAVIEIDAPLGLRPLLLPISQAYSYHARDLLQNAQTTGNADTLHDAENWTRQELALSPMSSSGWLRQAMISALENKPDSETNRLLDISYSVAPLDPEVFKYRTRFVLENWDRMSPTVRDDARAEITVGWRNFLEKDALQNMAPEIKNPAGRTALALQIQLMDGPGLPALKPGH